MPLLRVISPSMGVREYELKDALSIGRNESNAIHLAEEKASRQHCTVALDRGVARIEDLKSANGTYVNGHRVTSQVLQDNDRITIGATTIIFCKFESTEKLTDTIVVSPVKASESKPAAPIKKQPDSSVKNARTEAAAIRSPRPARRRSRSRGSDAVTAAVICFLVLGAAALLYVKSQTAASVSTGASIAQTSASRKEKVAVAETVPPNPDPNIMIKERAPEASEALPVALGDLLKTALAARDRALGNGNLLGAKAALQTFLAAVPPGQMNDENARRAKNELDDTTKVANAALDMSLNQAREALSARHFHLVSQRCTSLISNDPNGDYGKQARDMLERIDEQTAQSAANAKTKALDAVARGQLGEARAAVESVMRELNGTRWAGDIDTLQFQLIATAGFLDKVEAARTKKAAAGESVNLTYSAKKVEGKLLSVCGLQARIRVGAGQIEMAVPLKNLETRELGSVLDVLELSDSYSELTCLWSVLGRQEAALKASESALKKSGEIPIAASLAGMAANSKNLHLYDFKNWRQQLDWEAVSGSWLSQDGKYVLETPDGGETALKPASIGGPFPLNAARVSFELDIHKPSPDWFFTCELGDEKMAVVVAFNAAEVTLQDKTGAKSEPVKWSPAETRVDVAINGDTVSFSLGGKPGSTLAIAGISKQKGTISFHARQCGCAIDNVVLRSQE